MESWAFFSLLIQIQVTLSEGNTALLGTSGFGRYVRTRILSRDGRPEDTAFLGREEKVSVPDRLG
jgi:hypothetical protein